MSLIISMISSPSFLFLLALDLLCISYLALSTLARRRFKQQHSKRAALLAQAGLETDSTVAGFFHPYCNAGGGGERVLWTAIAFHQRVNPSFLALVYTGDNASKAEIIQRASDRFDIPLDPARLDFVHLRQRRWVEDAHWPRFTLLGQSLGSLILVWEALTSFAPDLYLDTMGYAFTYPLVQWAARVPVAAYTHYPTISTDMTRRVRQRQAGHTNLSSVSHSACLSHAKLIYYSLFMALYAFCLRRADVVMANSSWTHNHIRSILGSDDNTSIVYPPCDVRSLQALPLTPARQPIFLSLAQFRPEKEHPTQIRAIKALLARRPDSRAKLVLAGSVRNDADAQRVNTLKRLIKELEIEDAVEFVVNAPYSELLTWFAAATAGLSTMVDEHFGINVVEFMAAGMIPIAHPSAGPLLDIIVPYHGLPTGLHASDPEEFAQCMADVLDMSPHAQLELRQRARESVLERFSAAAFEEGWARAYSQLPTSSHKRS